MQGKEYLKVIDEGGVSRRKADVEPKIIEEVSLKDEESWTGKAAKFDVGGNYQAAADIYFTMYQKEVNPARKVKYGIYFVQMLINTTNLDKASQVLNDLESICANFPDDSVDRFRSVSMVREKQGWVADFQNKPQEEMEFLLDAEKIGQLIDLHDRTEDDNSRFLTIQHLMGRAFFKRALLEDDERKKKQDLEQAYMAFMKNKIAYEIEHSFGAVAFNEAWLARVRICQGNFDKAQQLIDSAKQNFQKAAKESGSDKIMDHYERLIKELSWAKQASAG